MSQLECVVTTIQAPTDDVRALAAREEVSRLIVIGDKKGPEAFDLAGADFYDLAAQLNLPYRLASMLPVGTYARKNVGYLLAMANGASCIYETDDDNAPLPGWHLRDERVEAVEAKRDGWVNAYRYFSDACIWPRGLPLDEINHPEAVPAIDPGLRVPVVAPIQQGLANGSPDVDAIWRLVLDREFAFQEGPSILLAPGAWCPFNSQSTWWWPEAYPLMYLPSFCSFRMTDIWRSFVAQHCLWALGKGVVFHAPEVVQERNEHDLMRDFGEEVDGYLGNRELARVLEGVALQPGPEQVSKNLRRCYVALVAAEFFPEKELRLLDAWIADLGCA